MGRFCQRRWFAGQLGDSGFRCAKAGGVVYQFFRARICCSRLLWFDDYFDSFRGKSMTKGLIAGLIGIVLSMAGTDPIWGDLPFYVWQL